MDTLSGGAGVRTNGVGDDWGIDGMEDWWAIDEADEARETGVVGRRWEPDEERVVLGGVCFDD